MATISSLGIEVGNTETEIIEATHTNKDENRTFGVGNQTNEIIATVWGSDDNQDWKELEIKTIAPGSYEHLIVGPSHDPWVKLTGRTMNPGITSSIDGYLIYSEPV